MFWAALFLAACLASSKRFSPPATLKVLILSVVLAVIANALRISSVFYLESATIYFGRDLHCVVHGGIGVAAFAISCLVLYVFSRNVGTSGTEEFLFTAVKLKVPSSLNKAAPSLNKAANLSFLLVCVVAAAIPMLQRPAQAISETWVSNYKFKGWPTTFEGARFNQVPLSPLNETFAAHFPGKIAVFANGNTRIVYRWMTAATHQLHPSVDCYRGGGYRIVWLPEHIDSENKRWAAFEAVKDNERLVVHERIVDESGNGWIDVSSWYWSAALHRSGGPWWCITVTQRID